MASKIDNRNQAISQIAAHLLENGLGQASLRQLAAAAGVSDRMLLYYFEDKADVLRSALEHIAASMALQLETTMPPDERLSPADFTARVTDMVRSDEMRSFFRLWVEIIAATAREEEPFATIARTIAAGFIAWIDVRLDMPESAARQAEAAKLLALIDGLVLLEICTNEETAAAAAGRLS